MKQPLHFLLIICLFLGACASKDENDLDLDEDQLYKKVQQQIDSGRYDLAVESLEALEARFPFGTYADQSQLLLIYAYYKKGESEAASSAASRFIRLHPQHPNVDYAYYLKGLSSFTEGHGLFERFLPTDLTTRDPGAARDSFADFYQLVSNFPESPYAADAEKRMIYLRNLLARYEVHVANYYFKRGAYLAAANRGRYVVENFQKTPAIPDALAVMTQAYLLLGYDELARDSLTVLYTNYPNHVALNSDGSFRIKDTRIRHSFISTLTAGLIDPPPPLGFDTRKQKR